MMTMPSIPQSLIEHAGKHPDKLCVADGAMELTYTQFLEASSGFASFLRKKGCNRGAYVIVQAAQSVPFAVAILGVQLAHCAYVLMDAHAPAQKIQSTAKETHAAFAVLRGETNCPCPQIMLDDVFPLAQETHAAAVGQFSPDPGAVSEILYTTGTTGTPKGVMHTFASEFACAENQVDSIDAKADDVWLVPMPLNHAMGLRKLHAALLTGSTAVFATGVALAGPLFSLMDRYGVTILSLVPANLSMLLRLWSDTLRAYNGRLRCVRLGAGSATQTDLIRLSEILPDVTVCNCYGTTEASNCAHIRYKGSPPAPGCVGKVNRNVRIRILGDDGEWIDAPGQPGRIVVEGKNLMLGYFGDPEETRRVLKDGRLLTADVGYFDPEGSLFLLGRIDEVINSGGFKISPGEVETAAMAIEGVADCACVPEASGILGQKPKLVVVMKDGYPFSADEIYSALSHRLDQHLLPRTIVQAETIPRTASGKIRRKLLIEQNVEEK